MENSNSQAYFDRNSEIKLFAVLGITLAIILAISLVLGLKSERRDASAPSESVLKQFPPVTLEAKAAYVYDARTQEVFYAKNEESRLPLASLTKIMTALVAYDLVPEHSTVTINDRALAVEGDSGLYRDERWSLKGILDFSLVTSSNDGMRAVALALGALTNANPTEEQAVNDFVGEMNRKAREIGLKNTYFVNETGLDLPTGQAGATQNQNGAYGTAEDMAKLIEYIVANNPGLLDATRDPLNAFISADAKVHLGKNTNTIVGEIPGILGSKTGYTDIAGGNLIVVFDPEIGRPIIVSVLGSSEQGRFSDMRKLVDATMKYINKN